MAAEKYKINQAINNKTKTITAKLNNLKIHSSNKKVHKT